MRLLEMFKSPKFQDVPLAQWLAFTPRELPRGRLSIDELVLCEWRHSSVGRSGCGKSRKAGGFGA